MRYMLATRNTADSSKQTSAGLHLLAIKGLVESAQRENNAQNQNWEQGAASVDEPLP